MIKFCFFSVIEPDSVLPLDELLAAVEKPLAAIEEPSTTDGLVSQRQSRSRVKKSAKSKTAPHTSADASEGMRIKRLLFGPSKMCLTTEVILISEPAIADVQTASENASNEVIENEFPRPKSRPRTKNTAKSNETPDSDGKLSFYLDVKNI